MIENVAKTFLMSMMMEQNILQTCQEDLEVQLVELMPCDSVFVTSRRTPARVPCANMGG